VVPPCRHFGICGGCQWQHMAYGAQLAHKREIVRDQMARIAKLPEVPVATVLGMDVPWHYRNHVQFALDDEGNLGYLAARSHRVVPIEECYLPHLLLEDILVSLDLDLPGLRSLSLRAGTNTGDLMVILETTSGDIPDFAVDVPVSCVLWPADGAPVALVGCDYIHEEVAGRLYRVSAGSFFQVNTAQAAHLVRLVTEALAPESDDVLLDMFCGVGTFGLSLAERVQAIIGVEESPSAVGDARANAKECGNVTILQGRAEDALPSLPHPVDLAVLDPPRAGVSPAALEALASLGPRRIAYVSCDPASLARDLGRLDAAGYAIRSIQPVDMFPQTYHIESVTLLER